MKMWTENEPRPEPKRRAELSHGDLTLSVSESDTDDSRRWLWVSLTYGSFDDRSFDECTAGWPAEAIAIVRQKLDELEAALKADMEECKPPWPEEADECTPASSV